MFAFLASGWTFFFRWPVIRVSASAFVPASLFLGPVFQAGVFALVAGLVALLPSAPAGLAAFLGFVALSTWSGFFHDDGFADTADSLGVSKFDASETTLDRIHAAMKDSRLGTFGTSALILLWAFRGLGAFLWHQPWPVLAAIVFVSRASAFAGAWALGRYAAPANARRSGHLMRSVGPGAFTAFVVGTAGGVVALASLVPGLSLGTLAAWCVLGGVVALSFLGALVRRCEGLSGDLIGAAVCLCEIVTLVAAACSLV
jgi:adenosylcobinamide-GDP ribazoletransferase